MNPRTFFLIRHGRSEGNDNPKSYLVKKDYEIDLTQEGVEQSIQAGKYFSTWADKQWEDTIIYCSPYVRTMATMMHALGPHYKCPVQIDYRIREQHFGSPKTMEEIMENWGKHAEDPFYFHNSGSEPSLSVFDRVHSWLDSVASKQNFNIIVFTHGHVINVITSIIQSTPMHEHIMKGYVRNGDVNKLKVIL
jgi:broad specificity phosphatase PhoE